MGISQLLQILKPLYKNVSLDELRGATVGIDGYCWLHRAAVTCARELH